MNDRVNDRGASLGTPAEVLAVTRDQLEAENERLRAAILDIDAHATALGEDEHGFVSGGYIISVGCLHRALGIIGHTAPPCRLCDPSQHSCLTTWGALAAAAQAWADATDLLDVAKAEERLRDAVRRWRA